ncbi:MAG: hemerythrin domain-containing protein [Pseudoxanthomonas sp.]|nr:hemerythrin domain-containing protein [Pseudoxanthomonas sp.]
MEGNTLPKANRRQSKARDCLPGAGIGPPVGDRRAVPAGINLIDTRAPQPWLERPHSLRPGACACQRASTPFAKAESHELQRSLCRKLLRSPAHSERRISRFTALRIELAAHAAAEERFLSVPVLMHDGGLQVSLYAQHEHHQIDELVEDLQTTDHNGRSWMATAKKLSLKVHHDLREGETKVLPGLRPAVQRNPKSAFDRPISAGPCAHVESVEQGVSVTGWS